MSERKPLLCPFCGAPATVVCDDSYGSCMVFCGCEAEPYICRAPHDLAGAIAAWNQRAPSPEQQAPPAPGAVQKMNDPQHLFLRRAALRRLVTAFEAFRDALNECDDYYELCAVALAPATDRLN